MEFLIRGHERNICKWETKRFYEKYLRNTLGPRINAMVELNWKSVTKIYVIYPCIRKQTINL